ncbi:MAG: HIT domain-containing protein [Proteobacteria bacterium]|nr:HIT domain-containing protein [Pseudomonadota bacterium]HQR02556.1 HIT domain-containing protein [Rhodocyclaceae bacterium]
MSYDQNNIFARILRHELPCINVYEDADTLAFMDIMPQAEGHALVITKEPAATLMEITPKGAAAVIRSTQIVARAVQTALGSQGIMIFQLNGSAAGQTVPHLHFHIIPRSGGDMLLKHAAEKADEKQLEALAIRIRNALADG